MHAKGATPDVAPPAFIYMNYRYHLEITANRPEMLPVLTTGLVTQTLNLSKRVMNKYSGRSIREQWSTTL
jgi:hypothetical protein